MKHFSSCLLALFLLFSTYLLFPNNIHATESESSNEENSSEARELIDLNLLTYDLNDSYFAISKNDDSGYNRALFFYFIYNKIKDRNNNQEYDNNISSIILVNDQDKEIELSNDFSCTFTKRPDGKLNEDLFVNLPMDLSDFTSKVTLTKIILTDQNKNKYTFNLGEYVVEPYDTLVDNDCYVVSAPIFAGNDNSKINLRYSLINNKKINFNEIILAYSDYKIIKDCRLVSMSNTNDADGVVEESEDRTYLEFELGLNPDNYHALIRPCVSLKVDGDKIINLIPPIGTQISPPEENFVVTSN